MSECDHIKENFKVVCDKCGAKLITQQGHTYVQETKEA